LLDANRGPNGTLVGHLARPNPQAAHLAAGRPVLAIFHGPHAYVSPAWYQTVPAVPTWNYVVVHARGVPTVMHDATRVHELLDVTVRAFEAPGSAWAASGLPEQYLSTMARGVVAFELPVDRLEGKFKLSQNRPPADRAGVIAALQAGDAEARAVAALMTGG
jgi:transcriptional regulator